MTKKKRRAGLPFLTSAALSICAGPPAARAEPTQATIGIDVGRPGPVIQPTFYGLMTEEINHSYDGGLYAELIRNRTFQDDAKTPVHWTLVQDRPDGKAAIKVDRGDPVNAALPVSLRLTPGDGRAGVANGGFWGVPVRPGTKYAVTFYAKAADDFAGAVTAAIVGDDGATYAATDTPPVGKAWQKYTLTLNTAADAPTTAKAKFVLSAAGKGSVCFSYVSLFPPTYLDRPNGLRPDLMKLMADLRPAFIRLPGGNYLEGNSFKDRFDWKKMIGPPDQRPGHKGCWGYRSSDGMGLPEFMLWCRQLNAEPVLGVFAGYTLDHDKVTGDALTPYVNEALEEIEYFIGGPDTTWGKKRATDGFPEPFPLRYVEIGNEDTFDPAKTSAERFKPFYDAIKAKYPQIKVIAAGRIKGITPDLVDDHFYRPPRDIGKDYTHYDKMPREGPQVFVGEWASMQGRPTPDLAAGLADAAWVMAMQRNADLIPMQCYAPLLANVNPGASQWETNLIGYDALGSFGSPSYYAQCMFAQNRGDVVLPTTVQLTKVAAPTTRPEPHGRVGVGTWHVNAEFKDVTLTHGTAADQKTTTPADLVAKTPAVWQSSSKDWSLNDKDAKTSGDVTWALTGDPSWTDFTLRFKLKQTGGWGGIAIPFHVADGANFSWWNIGGLHNHGTQLETCVNGWRETVGPFSKFKLKTGQWYDVRLEVAGRHVRGYVDNALITDTTLQPPSNEKLFFASASYLNAGHEAVVKVVNLSSHPVDAALNLKGVAAIDPVGTSIVLSGEPWAFNSVQEPRRVAPVESTVNGVGSSFRREFPPYSFTVLRLKTTR